MRRLNADKRELQRESRDFRDCSPLQGFRGVLFSNAAGPLAVFSKRFVFELIEDEDG
jgi:hypothetical protein